MLTLTQQRDFYGLLTTGTANTQNLNFGERIINSETRRIVAKLGDNLLHTTGTASAVANQQAYELPNKMKKLRGVVFTIGNDSRQARRSPNREHWDYLNTSSATAYTSDFADWYYLLNRQILYWPTPASASAVITYDYDKLFADSTVADYTTGTIQQVTNGSTSIIGASTSWGSAMVGRFLRIEKSNTWGNDGDGYFYEIDSVTSTTRLELTKNYEGHTIVGGAAVYLIGEVSPLPDGFHELPVYRAAEFYFSKIDQARSQYFRQLANDLETELLAANEPSQLVVVEEDEDREDNPNLYPRSIG